MPKQLLLVDDSVTVHRVVEITFAREDFTITAVKSGDEALGRVKDLKPDVVLADAGMPGKSGYDVCAALKADPATSSVPVLILTGNFSPYDEPRGSKAGASGFVIKPFETQALLDKVNDAIKRGGGAVVAQAAAVAAPKPPEPAFGNTPTIGAKPPVPTAKPMGAGGVEPLSKPLSVVAQETPSAKTVLGEAAPPLPIQGAPPAPPPGLAPKPLLPPATAAPRPAPPPRATLMGIPVVNPNNLSSTSPGTQVPPPPVKPPTPWQPPAPVAAPKPAPEPPKPIVEAPKPAPPEARTMAMEAPKLDLPPPKPAIVDPPRPVAVAPKPAPPPPVVQRAIPASVPQMPRPSLIPGAPVPEVGRPVAVTGPAMSQLVEAVADRAQQLAQAPVAAGQGTGQGDHEVLAKMSREVIERIAWEIIPELAETIIKEQLERLEKQRQSQG